MLNLFFFKLYFKSKETQALNSIKRSISINCQPKSVFEEIILKNEIHVFIYQQRVQEDQSMPSDWQMTGWILKQPVDLVYILYVCKRGGDIAGSLTPVCREGVPSAFWKAGQSIIPALTTWKSG